MKVIVGLRVSTWYHSPSVQCIGPSVWLQLLVQGEEGMSEQFPWDIWEHVQGEPPYILSVSCSRAPTRLMTWEAGWTVSYSAKRWHTFSWALVWLLATNPKILVGKGSLSEEGVPGVHQGGTRPTVLHPAPSLAKWPQHLTPMGALGEG